MARGQDSRYAEHSSPWIQPAAKGFLDFPHEKQAAGPVELDAGLAATEEGGLAAVLVMLAGVEVEGTVGAGEGRGHGGAVAEDLAAEELEALAAEFQAPAPVFHFVVIHQGAGQGDGGAAGEPGRDENMRALRSNVA